MHFLDFDMDTFLKIEKHHIKDILTSIVERIKFESAFFDSHTVDISESIEQG